MARLRLLCQLIVFTVHVKAPRISRCNTSVTVPGSSFAYAISFAEPAVVYQILHIRPALMTLERRSVPSLPRLCLIAWTAPGTSHRVCRGRCAVTSSGSGSRGPGAAASAMKGNGRSHDRSADRESEIDKRQGGVSSVPYKEADLFRETQLTGVFRYALDSGR